MTVTIFKTNNPGSDHWYYNPKYEQKQTWNFLMLLTRQLFYLPSHLRHSFHPDCRSALNTYWGHVIRDDYKSVKIIFQLVFQKSIHLSLLHAAGTTLQLSILFCKYTFTFDF